MCVDRSVAMTSHVPYELERVCGTHSFHQLPPKYRGLRLFIEVIEIKSYRCIYTYYVHGYVRAVFSAYWHPSIRSHVTPARGLFLRPEVISHVACQPIMSLCIAWLCKQRWLSPCTLSLVLHTPSSLTKGFAAILFASRK